MNTGLVLYVLFILVFIQMSEDNCCVRLLTV